MLCLPEKVTIREHENACIVDRHWPSEACKMDPMVFYTDILFYVFKCHSDVKVLPSMPCKTWEPAIEVEMVWVAWNWPIDVDSDSVLYHIYPKVFCVGFQMRMITFHGSVISRMANVEMNVNADPRQLEWTETCDDSSHGCCNGTKLVLGAMTFWRYTVILALPDLRISG